MGLPYLDVPDGEFSLWRWPSRCVVCLDPTAELLRLPPPQVRLIWGEGSLPGVQRTYHSTGTVPLPPTPYCAAHLAPAHLAGDKEVARAFGRQDIHYLRSNDLQRLGVESALLFSGDGPSATVHYVRLKYSNPEYAIRFARENLSRYLALLRPRGPDQVVVATDLLIVEGALRDIVEPNVDHARALVEHVRALASMPESARSITGASVTIRLGVGLRSAVTALGAIGAPAGPVVLEAVSDPDPVVRQWMATALATVPALEGSANLIGLAREDPNPHVREAAVRSLGEAFAGEPAALAALEATAGDDPERKVRKVAAKQLKQVRRSGR